MSRGLIRASKERELLDGRRIMGALGKWGLPATYPSTGSQKIGSDACLVGKGVGLPRFQYNVRR